MWLSNKLGSLWAWPHTWLFGTWPHKNWGSGTFDTHYVWRKATGLHGEADNRGDVRHAWLRLYSIETNRNNEDILDMYSHIQTSKTQGAQEPRLYSYLLSYVPTHPSIPSAPPLIESGVISQYTVLHVMPARLECFGASSAWTEHWPLERTAVAVGCQYGFCEGL